MNFQATKLMYLVGKKKPTSRYRILIIKLLNCLRDYRASYAISNSEKVYLLKQIKERDTMIDTLIKKNTALMEWKHKHEEKTYSKICMKA